MYDNIANFTSFSCWIIFIKRAYFGVKNKNQNTIMVISRE